MFILQLGVPWYSTTRREKLSMSGAMDLDMNERATVYVKLLGEGVPVLRPVPATVLSTNTYRLEATENYDSDDEVWEFPPGATVRCERQSKDGHTMLVAVAAV